jgi:hypothetical protein
MLLEEMVIELDLDGLVILGIVLAAFVVLVSVGLLLFLWFRHRRHGGGLRE